MKLLTSTAWSLLLMAIILTLPGCATTTSAPEATPSIAMDDFAVDPRAGFSGTGTRAAIRGYEAAMRELAAGRSEQAERRLETVAQQDAGYLPASVALAAIALGEDDLDRAESRIESVLDEQPDYMAARIVWAEIAGARDDVEQAFTTYRELSSMEEFPASLNDRLRHFQQSWFERLFDQASRETSPERSIEVLRQALSVMPEARAARQMLVDKLIAAQKFDDARRQVEPLIDRTRPNAPEVEAALAEIDFGKGRYQEAIERLEPLARADPARYGERLELVKQRWSESNMPPRYHRAVASPALTRAELAVLLYWKLPFVRFAQNLSSPPIAIDISEVEGREEFVRALAMRFFDVDPITRAASPYRTVSTDGFLRLTGRLLTLRGVPECAASVPNEGDAASAQRMLRACGISLSALREPSVSGATASSILEAIARVSSAG